MLERQGVVSGECLKVCGHEVMSQDACGTPLCDKAVMEVRSGMAQGEQGFGLAIFLKKDIIDCRKSILQVTERSDVTADPLSNADDGPCILDDSPQLGRDDVVDDGVNEPHSPTEPIEDRRLAHPSGRGDLIEGRREPLLPEHPNRRMQDPIDVSTGIRTESGRTSGIGHDATSLAADD